MYFTDRGIEELEDRRGGEQVSIGWLAERLRDFVDEHPESEATIDSLASWLARLDEGDEEDVDVAGSVQPIPSADE
jgi:DNA-binding transcriptional LysR family regulator